MNHRESVETVLRGGLSPKIPFTIYENKLPKCAVERELRNRGLVIVNRTVPVFTTRMPNVEVRSYSYNEGSRYLTRMEYKTPCGTVDTIIEPAGFTSWTHKKLFTMPEDYKPVLFMIKDTVFEPCYESFIAAEKADGGDSFFRGYMPAEPMQQLISYYMGAEVFCMEWFDRQHELMKLYEAIVESNRKTYELCASSPALAFNYGGNVTPEIVGLDRFKKYYMPHYNEAAEVLHSKGKLLGVHFDANCGLFADSIAESKLDYIEAFTPAPDTDMMLAQARAAWPEKVLWINFPSSVHLESQETIARTTYELLNQVSSPRKFIMGITEDVPQDRWQQNLLTISDVLNGYEFAA